MRIKVFGELRLRRSLLRGILVTLVALLFYVFLLIILCYTKARQCSPDGCTSLESLNSWRGDTFGRTYYLRGCSIDFVCSYCCNGFCTEVPASKIAPKPEAEAVAPASKQFWCTRRLDIGNRRALPASSLAFYVFSTQVKWLLSGKNSASLAHAFSVALLALPLAFKRKLCFAQRV